MMDPEEATAALAHVDRTRARLAEMAHWPFHRHAMFGLSEALFVAAMAQPMALAVGMGGVAIAVFAVCILDDRRRHGMFVSGWQAGDTRSLTVSLTMFVVLAAACSVWLRDGVTTQPLGYLLGLVTFVACTAASLWWEKIYRAELSSGIPG